MDRPDVEGLLHIAESGSVAFYGNIALLCRYILQIEAHVECDKVYSHFAGPEKDSDWDPPTPAREECDCDWEAHGAAHAEWRPEAKMLPGEPTESGAAACVAALKEADGKRLSEAHELLLSSFDAAHEDGNEHGGGQDDG